MTAARTNAPTLAWLLTALTCLLAGLAIGEYRHETVALPAVPPGDGVETVAVASPCPTSAPPHSPPAAGTPSPTLFFESAPVRLAAGPARRVARLTVPPGVELSSAVVPGPVVLFVETGALVVLDDGVATPELGLSALQFPRVLHAGQRVVVAPGERYATRAAGPAPAMVLTVAIVPG